MTTSNIFHSLFQSLSPNDDEVLYIIGNGFDISHGINSKYSDFKNFVLENGNRNHVNLMDTFFSQKEEFWCDIEESLGDYNEENIYEFCKPDEEIDLDHTMRDIARAEDGPDWLFKPELDKFKEEFHDWVNQIDISVARPLCCLPWNSKYLTFNYTNTLEQVYNIPSQQICHIHGSRINNNEEYVIGHNCLKDENTHREDDGDLFFEADTMNKIIGWMNELYKDTKAIIRKHSDFFSKLANIKCVVVKGHSMNDIDWPYFDEVCSVVDKNARWVFNCFSNLDVVNVKKYITQSGLSNLFINEV